MKPFEDMINKAQQEKAERLKQSAEHLKQYLETRDPQIVIDYILSSLYAIEENHWIVEIIEKWRREGEYELLKKLFSRPRGVKKAGNDNLNLKGIMVVQVDSLTSQGLSHEEAFKRLTSLGGIYCYEDPVDKACRSTDPVDKACRNEETMKKAYYKTRKKMYQLFVKETKDYYILTFYNARVSIPVDGGYKELFGSHKWWIPKDTTKGDEVTFKVEGVGVYDEAFQRLRVLMSAVDHDKAGS